MTRRKERKKEKDPRGPPEQQLSKIKGDEKNMKSFKLFVQRFDELNP